MMESFNHFGDIAAMLHMACSQVVRKTAFDLQATAAGLAPVDTGFLRNSIYVVTSDESGYQGGDKALPAVETPSDDTTAYVAVGASYGLYVEYGTRFMPPQPYFLPAVDQVRPSFEAAIEAIKTRMEEAAG